ncbi:MAG: VTT domain-containing protein [Gemmatimonadota bacterium]|nr:VTT domain-containing protein [Gemmatimonadota bacterium]
MFLNQLGVPVPAVPYMLAAGALAGLGQLDLGLLILISVAAALPADLLWYEIGRRRGMGAIRFMCRVSLEPDSCVRDTESRFARHGAHSLVVAKFIPGVETVAPPLAGVFRMRRSRFLLFDALGTTLWSALFLGLGYLFHEQVDRIARLAARLGGWLGAILALALAAYLGWKYLRRRRFLRELRIARITPEELRARLEAGEEIEIVDVRHSVDFEAEPATIPGAKHIAVEDFEDRHQEIPRDREVVLYCT